MILTPTAQLTPNPYGYNFFGHQPVAWFDKDYGITKASTLVSAWRSRVNGGDWTVSQSTDDNKPSQASDGAKVRFDGNGANHELLTGGPSTRLENPVVLIGHLVGYLDGSRMICAQNGGDAASYDWVAYGLNSAIPKKHRVYAGNSAGGSNYCYPPVGENIDGNNKTGVLSFRIGATKMQATWRGNVGAEVAFTRNASANHEFTIGGFTNTVNGDSRHYVHEIIIFDTASMSDAQRHAIADQMAIRNGLTLVDP